MRARWMFLKSECTYYAMTLNKYQNPLVTLSRSGLFCLVPELPR